MRTWSQGLVIGCSIPYWFSTTEPQPGWGPLVLIMSPKAQHCLFGLADRDIGFSCQTPPGYCQVGYVSCLYSTNHHLTSLPRHLTGLTRSGSVLWAIWSLV